MRTRGLSTITKTGLAVFLVTLSLTALAPNTIAYPTVVLPDSGSTARFFQTGELPLFDSWDYRLLSSRRVDVDAAGVEWGRARLRSVDGVWARTKLIELPEGNYAAGVLVCAGMVGVLVVGERRSRPVFLNDEALIAEIHEIPPTVDLIDFSLDARPNVPTRIRPCRPRFFRNQLANDAFFMPRRVPMATALVSQPTSRRPRWARKP